MMGLLDCLHGSGLGEIDHLNHFKGTTPNHNAIVIQGSFGAVPVLVFVKWSKDEVLKSILLKCEKA